MSINIYKAGTDTLQPIAGQASNIKSQMVMAFPDYKRGVIATLTNNVAWIATEDCWIAFSVVAVSSGTPGSYKFYVDGVQVNYPDSSSTTSVTAGSIMVKKGSTVSGNGLSYTKVFGLKYEIPNPNNEYEFVNSFNGRNGDVIEDGSGLSKLGENSVGTSNVPIYLNNGVPTPCNIGIPTQEMITFTTWENLPNGCSSVLIPQNTVFNADGQTITIPNNVRGYISKDGDTGNGHFCDYSGSCVFDILHSSSMSPGPWRIFFDKNCNNPLGADVPTPIGKWIDSKIIYKKTIVWTSSLSMNVENKIGNIGVCNTIIKIDHVIKLSSHNKYYNDYFKTNSSCPICIRVDPDNGDVYAAPVNEDWSAPKLIVTIEYTK